MSELEYRCAIRRRIDIVHIHWLRQRKDQKEYEIEAFFPLLHLDICQIARSKWKKSRCQLKTRLLFSRCVLRTSRKRKLRRHRRRRRRSRRRRSRGREKKKQKREKNRLKCYSVDRHLSTCASLVSLVVSNELTSLIRSSLSRMTVMWWKWEGEETEETESKSNL